MSRTDGERRATRPVIRGALLRKAFIGRFLDEGLRSRKRLRNNADASQFLLSRSLADLGGTPITGPDPDTDERVARTMAAEVVAAVHRTGGKSGMHWYTLSIERAVAVTGLLHPEVVDPEAAARLGHVGIGDVEDARTVLFCAMSITSQNVPVTENMGYAIEQYRAFLATGRFEPKGYGVRGASVRGNLERFNQMLDVFDGDLKALRSFLTSEFTMRELKEAANASGIPIGTSEMLDETVHGSMVFGPKIGNGFLQNLFGNYRALTVDMWFARTWGRYTGTLVRNMATDAQVARLVETMRDVGEPFAGMFAEQGVTLDPDGVADLDPVDLLALVRNMHATWNRGRKQLADAGADNATLGEAKARLGWPNAAAAVMDGLSATVDAPTSAGQRKWIRGVVGRCLKVLSRHGYELSAAEVQAILWYPEKELYAALTNRRANTYTTSYDEAVIAIAKAEGHHDEDIEAVLHTDGAHGRDGPGGPRAPGRGDGGPVQGHGPQARGRGQGPEDGAEEPVLSDSEVEEPETAFVMS